MQAVRDGLGFRGVGHVVGICDHYLSEEDL